MTAFAILSFTITATCLIVGLAAYAAEYRLRRSDPRRRVERHHVTVVDAPIDGVARGWTRGGNP